MARVVAAARKGLAGEVDLPDHLREAVGGRHLCVTLEPTVWNPSRSWRSTAGSGCPGVVDVLVVAGSDEQGGLRGQPGPEASATHGRRPAARSRSRMNSTVGDDMLPYSANTAARRGQRLSPSPSASPAASRMCGPPGWIAQTLHRSTVSPLPPSHGPSRPQVLARSAPAPCGQRHLEAVVADEPAHRVGRVRDQARPGRADAPRRRPRRRPTTAAAPSAKRAFATTFSRVRRRSGSGGCTARPRQQHAGGRVGAAKAARPRAAR